MVAAIATRGSLEVLSAAHIRASGLTANAANGDPITMYMTLEKSGQDTLRGPVFSGTEFEWQDLVLPATGTWTAHVRKVSDDSSVVSASVVVTA